MVELAWKQAMGHPESYALTQTSGQPVEPIVGQRVCPTESHAGDQGPQLQRFIYIFSLVSFSVAAEEFIIRKILLSAKLNYMFE